MKYYPNEEMINKEISKYFKAVQMFEIKIEHMSGKEVQEKQNMWLYNINSMISCLTK